MNKFEMKGSKELVVKLNNLSTLTQHKVMGSIIFKASKIMEDEQKKVLMTTTKTINPTTGIPNTGNLLKSIGRNRVPISKATDVGAVKIGPRTGRGYKGYHAHLLEFGHEKVLWGRRTNGRVKKFPFVEPAYRSKIDAVRRDMSRHVDSVLRRFIKTGKITVTQTDYD
jgi:hypothetical protein